MIGALIVAVSFATAFLSSIFGMLGGLILMAVLAQLLVSVSAAFVLHGLIQLASNGYRGFLNRKDINWRIVLFFAFGVGGALVGFALLQWVPDRAVVFLGLGLLPFLARAIPQGWALNATRPAHALAAGLSTGLVSLLSGVGGPLLDVFFQRTALPRHQVVATKAVAQSLSHFVKIIYFGFLVAGASLAEVFPPLWLLGACLITTLIGTRLGKRVLDKMDDAVFYRWTNYILLGVGAVLLMRAAVLFLA